MWNQFDVNEDGFIEQQALTTAILKYFNDEPFIQEAIPAVIKSFNFATNIE